MRRCGDMNSPVQIKCAVKGNSIPPLPKRFLEVSARVGIDVNPLDVSDREHALWLRALVWPEHEERAEILQQAIQVTRQNPPTLVAGDGVESLPAVIEAVPKDSVLCITRMFTPIAPISRDRLSSLISSYGAKRDVFVVSY